MQIITVGLVLIGALICPASTVPRKSMYCSENLNIDHDGGLQFCVEPDRYRFGCKPVENFRMTTGEYKWTTSKPCVYLKTINNSTEVNWTSKTVSIYFLMNL